MKKDSSAKSATFVRKTYYAAMEHKTISPTFRSLIPEDVRYERIGMV